MRLRVEILEIPMKIAVFALLFGAVALLAAPTPKENKKLPPPTAKELKQSQDNLKQIGIAFHNYIDKTNSFPNNVVNKDGKATLSWRVLLLPYLDEGALYKEFKLDEPWDSKHNQALIEKIPKVFAPIRVPAEKGVTFYRGYTGADTIFELDKILRFAHVTDGLSNTILAIEAGEPCIWTKPDDLPYDAEKPLPKLGGLFEGDFHVLMCDGSVHRGYSTKMVADEFKKMVTRSDGMVLDSDKGLGIEKK